MAKTLDVINLLRKTGLLERLPKKTQQIGLKDFQRLIDAVRDKKYKRVQGIGDDYIPNSGLYNAVGAIYPLLNREQRDEALRAHLHQFDGLNYSAVNTNHTPFIREPLLLTDITITNRFYWPGFLDEEAKWKGKSLKDLQEEGILQENGLFNPEEVQNDFLFAYALMRTDHSDIAEDYAKIAHPDFLERTLKGISAMRFAKQGDKKKIEKRAKRLRKVLPKNVAEQVIAFKDEADWADPKNFP